MIHLDVNDGFDNWARTGMKLALAERVTRNATIATIFGEGQPVLRLPRHFLFSNCLTSSLYK